MSADDRYLEPIKRTHQEAVMSLLGSAADHLRLVGESGAHQSEISPFAYAALVRSAITTGSTAMWLVDGDQDTRRERALVFNAADLRSYRTFIENTEAGYAAQEAQGVEAELAILNERLDWVLAEFNKVTGRSLGRAIELERCASDSKMVRYAGEQLDPSLARPGLTVGQELLAQWQFLSGYAHGRPWAYRPAMTVTGPGAEPGLKTQQISGDPNAIMHHAQWALLVLQEALRKAVLLAR